MCVCGFRIRCYRSFSLGLRFRQLVQSQERDGIVSVSIVVCRIELDSFLQMERSLLPIACARQHTPKVRPGR